MKRNIVTKALTGVILSASLLSLSCQNILNEEPRSAITTDLFKSADGITLALSGVYSFLRNYYGPLGIYAEQVMGTDEVAMGQNQFQLLEEVSIAPDNNPANSWWSGDAFAVINTCNGIIEKGTEFEVDAAILAEARVLRALFYFNLVRTSGPAPLDLGSGPLVFNEAYTDTSVRNSVQDVYAAVFADLETAIIDLNGIGRENARQRGAVTKTFAQHTYALAKLTYGWWLEFNAGGSGAAAEFQAAYNTALDAINDTSSGFGLMEYYFDVNEASQDRNKEWVFYADRDYSAPYIENGVTSGGFASSGAPENSAFLLIRMMHDQPVIIGAGTPVPRGNSQDTGRPWYRGAPPYEVTNTIFNNKEHDKRYWGTFQEAWVYEGFPNNPQNGMQSVNGGPDWVVGDTVWYIPAITPARINEAGRKGTANGEANYAYQTIPGMKAAVWDLDHYTNLHYPTLWKLGPYRPELATIRVDESAASLRPFCIAKFSEFYLIAAEAAIKGATGAQSATQLLNHLRTRAAGYKNRTGVIRSTADSQASAAYLTSQTPANPDINYLLDERMRELYGEGFRWFDLARTKTWGQRAATYTIRDAERWNDAAAGAVGRVKEELAPKTTITRARLVNLPNDSHLYLRPIPQGSIDALNLPQAEKAAYQNPGY
jgi:hypothetical protein